jgi:hypothetical protein
MSVGATGHGQGLWYLDELLVPVARREVPIPPEYHWTDPPRILRVLKPRKNLYGMEVEIPREKIGKRQPDPPHYTTEQLEYVGNEIDGVYYGAVQDETYPSRWWAMAVVDSETGGFVDTLAEDYGYESESRAQTAALDAAVEWLLNNNIQGWED